MSVDRAHLLAAFRAAVVACDPAARVRDAIASADIAPVLAGRRRFGVAIGKAALAMACGAGPVERGVIVVPAGAALDGGEPHGWRIVESAHPFVDERSVAAARAAHAVIDAAREGDVVLALISGGASALIEEPIDGVTLAELAARTRAVMEAGAPIDELNAVRSSLSRVKRGGLVARCAAPVVTLAVSDIIGDGLATIGSGPTIGAWFVDSADFKPAIANRDQDHAHVVGRMSSFSTAAMAALGDQVWLERIGEPLAGDVADCAARLVAAIGPSAARVHGTFIAWGEPTLRVPADHGEGGRAQQLALHLAHALRGTALIALAIGSDGVDGPPPKGRAAPAGAIVDGTTWDAIVAAGLDPARSLARCDAGPALAAANALVVTGPTGVNHGDLVIIGDARA